MVIYLKYLSSGRGHGIRMSKAGPSRKPSKWIKGMAVDDDDMEDFLITKKSRFSVPVSDSRMKEITKGYVPQNTKKNTAWGVNVFVEWIAARNKDGEERCPEDILERANPGNLNHWLCRFVTEVRKKDGSAISTTF